MVLDCDEDGAEYEAMLNDVLEDLAPVGAVETYLAERLAQLLWRLRRVLRFETRYLSQWQLDSLPSPALLAEEIQQQAKRDSVLAALACLLLPGDDVLEEPTVAAILEACLQTLDESHRGVFLGVPGEPLQVLAAEASAPPYTVRAVLDFLRAGEGRLGASSSRFTFNNAPMNFVGTVYQFWTGAEHQWRRMSDIAERNAERKRTEGLLLQSERAAILIERYEPKLRRDLSRTLSDFYAVQAVRQNRCARAN
ncbi:MAG: hypothetical protein WB615_09705 [Candidatus Tumulicola sp.]